MEWVRCCKCDEEVRIPAANWDAHVRCPHCGESYPLEELLESLPPLLEVVPSPAPTIVVPKQQAAPRVVTGELERGPQAVQGSVHEPQRLDIQEPADPRVLMPSPMKLDALRRRPMSQRFYSGFLKIALGGMAGLLIGQLILWWLPPPYRSDPLDLAKQLPHQIAFLAPPELRRPIFDLGVDNQELDGGLTDFDLPTEQSIAAPDADDSLGSTDLPGDALDAIPLPPDGRPDAGQNTVLGLQDAPQIPMPELVASLENARQALQADAEDGFDELYQQLAQLAYNITFADINEPKIGEFASSVESFLVELSAEPARLDKIAAQATISLGKGDAVDRKGVLVVGKITGLTEVGQLFQSEIAMQGVESAVVPVISHGDPVAKGVYQLEDRVLIVGAIVNNPSLHLLGYRGGADVVVLGGLPLKLPSLSE